MHYETSSPLRYATLHGAVCVVEGYGVRVFVRHGRLVICDGFPGERRERTEWHRVVIFSEGLCRVAEQYLKKGSKVYLEGQLQTRKWQDQSGQDKYTTEVVLQRFRGELTMLDGRSSESSGMAEAHADTGNYAGSSGGGSSRGAPSGGDLDDEIPF